MSEESQTFSYEEALATFPTVERLTDIAVRQVEALFNRVQSLEEMENRRSELEDTYRQIVDAWASEVRALGCQVKGLWLVDWDSGGGYYCWRYPEATIAHFHDYEAGYQSRVPIN